MLDSRQRGRGLESHRHHCVVSLSKTYSLKITDELSIEANMVDPEQAAPIGLFVIEAS